MSTEDNLIFPTRLNRRKKFTIDSDSIFFLQLFLCILLSMFELGLGIYYYQTNNTCFLTLVSCTSWLFYDAFFNVLEISTLAFVLFSNPLVELLCDYHIGFGLALVLHTLIISTWKIVTFVWLLQNAFSQLNIVIILSLYTYIVFQVIGYKMIKN